MNKTLEKILIISVLSYEFWSHKVMCWLVPVMLIFLFISDLLLINYHQVYFFLFILQLIFCLLSLLGFLFSLFKINIPLVSLVYYYIVTILVLLIGLSKFLFKKHTLYLGFNSTININVSRISHIIFISF